MAGHSVSYPTNGITSNGYLAIPASGRGAGILVIQEWWGLTDQIKEMADEFANQGFVALAPDLYHGQTASEPDEAGKLMMALNIDQAAKDLRGAADFLAGHAAVTSQKLGVIGFCMGGQLALYAGTVAPERIGAVVDMYGIHPNVKPDFSKMTAPVLGLFGGKDAYVPAEAIEALSKELSSRGIRHDLHTYADCDHAFMNDRNTHGYEAGATSDAYSRILPFFRSNLA